MRARRLLLHMVLGPVLRMHAELVLLVPQLHLRAVPIGGVSVFSTNLCCVFCILPAVSAITSHGSRVHLFQPDSRTLCVVCRKP